MHCAGSWGPWSARFTRPERLDMVGGRPKVQGGLKEDVEAPVERKKTGEAKAKSKSKFKASSKSKFKFKFKAKFKARDPRFTLSECWNPQGAFQRDRVV